MAVSETNRQGKQRLGLAQKLALAFVGLVTFVLVVNGALSMWLTYDEARAAAVRVQQEKAEAAAERVEQFITEIEGQLGWTTRAEWDRVSLDQRRYDFIRLLRQVPAITELTYIDGTGHEQLKLSRLELDVVGGGADVSTEPRFRDAIAQHVWYGPVTFRRGSEPYMTIAVAHAGRNPGVTAAEVNLKLIWDVLTALRVGQGGYAFVTDARGRLIAHPDMSLVLRDTDLARLPQVASAIADPNEPTRAATTMDGRSMLSAHAVVPKLGWIVFVELPTREALAPVYAALLETALLLGLGLLVAAVMGTALARRMVGPIRALQAGAERLGEGDLSQRIAVHTGDEIETLADRFNQMAGRIQESYETLEAQVETRTRDLNESLHQQTATAEVLKVISRSAFDLQSVLDTLIESAVRLCNASQGIVWLRDGDLFRARARHGGSPTFLEFLRQNPLPVGSKTTVGRVAMTGTVQNIPDIQADPEFDFPGMLEHGALRSLLGVPLLRGGRVEGVLVLARPEQVPFTSRQIELATTFGDQAVIAVENTRLFDEVQARTRDLTEALKYQSATADVLKSISRSAFDLDTVLDTLTRSAAALCDATTGSIRLRHGDGFRVGAVFGGGPEWLKFMRENPLLPGRGSISARVALSHAVEQVGDMQADPEMLPELQTVTPNRAALGVPLLRDGELEGVFVLGRTRPEPFTERQIELVQTFADQALIAIENARLFNEVQARTRELAQSLDHLRAAQDRLVQTEKLASLGQLTAGIAHEIKNPLNFINNFSALSTELIEELHAVLATAQLDASARTEVEELTGMLKSNLEKVVQHGKRADNIVKNMLLHSRESGGEQRSVDLNATVEEALNLAYHGARAEKPGFNIALVRQFDPAVGSLEIYPQEFTRVLLNVFSNGFYAATRRKTETADPAFEPTLTVTTEARPDHIAIRIRDNGIGMSDTVKARLFEPFFTTKPAGEGTGLGLSLSHDIVVKQHGGSITVESRVGDYTEFSVILPRGSTITPPPEA